MSALKTGIGIRHRFFATTDGWDAPILRPDETALIDARLAALAVTIKELD